MPGKRKFHLSTRKNYYRKKCTNPSVLIVRIPRTAYDLYVNKDSVEVPEPPLSSLVVSIPRAMYCSISVRDRDHLFERISMLKILPAEWYLAEEDHVISKSFSYGRLCISVDSNCHWIISINQYQIDLPNDSFCKITSVTTFIQLLTAIEKSHLCIGNPDDKFYSVRDIRKGKFLDQSGESVLYEMNISLIFHNSYPFSF